MSKEKKKQEQLQRFTSEIAQLQLCERSEARFNLIWFQITGKSPLTKSEAERRDRKCQLSCCGLLLLQFYYNSLIPSPYLKKNKKIAVSRSSHEANLSSAGQSWPQTLEPHGPFFCLRHSRARITDLRHHGPHTAALRVIRSMSVFSVFLFLTTCFVLFCLRHDFTL